MKKLLLFLSIFILSGSFCFGSENRGIFRTVTQTAETIREVPLRNVRIMIPIKVPTAINYSLIAFGTFCLVAGTIKDSSISSVGGLACLLLGSMDIAGHIKRRIDNE